jgi:hypothetical protein
MQSSYTYIAESNYQHLRIRLVGSEFVDTKTPLAEMLGGVTISLSGTKPCVLVELNCYDVAALLAHNDHKILFSRLCGPDIYAFIEAQHFYFNFQSQVNVSLEEIKGWQLLWMPVQNDILEQLGRNAVVLIEAESDDMADILITPPNRVSNNVVPLFGDR